MLRLLPRKDLLMLSIVVFCLLMPALFSYAKSYPWYEYIDKDGVIHFSSSPVNKPGWILKEEYRNVKQVQTGLSQLGYYQGRIDGILGLKTSGAIKKFQKNIGVPVTGKIDNHLKSQIEIAKKKDKERRINNHAQRTWY